MFGFEQLGFKRDKEVALGNPVSALIKELETIPDGERVEAGQIIHGLNSDVASFLFENKDSL
ncbi:hypothetical protein HQ571_01040 [Candidatus Kuenenbacteria bacterium]|nr:hypothetical protein [Candidatus Kuenenbacteria bacterium]